jgi:hypothetical protein
MPGEFDGVVDSLSPQPTTREPLERVEYHLDQHIDHRQASTPSVAESADALGIVTLQSPNPQGIAQEVLLAANQDGLPDGATVVMKPRAVEVQRGDGPAKRGKGAVMSSRDLGLSERPILIQTCADVDKFGVPMNIDGFKPKVFASDGTAAGLQNINATQSVTNEDGGEVRVKAPVVKVAEEAPVMAERVPRAAPVAPVVNVPPPKPPRRRVVFMPADGSKVRSQVDDIILSPSIIILIYDADAETIYEPNPAGAKAPLQLQIDANSYQCIYGGWSAEKDNKLYFVFVIVPAAQ